MESHSESDQPQTEVVALPAPTAWPMVLALGLSLVVAGMVTNVAISLLGLLLTLRASVGWFRQVLPVEHHESVAVQAQPMPVVSARASVARLPIARCIGRCCRWRPTRSPPGSKAVSRAASPCRFRQCSSGWIKYHSIWYAINLLAAGGFVSWAGQSNAFLAEFHLRGLLAALAIHGAISLLVGLLYGAMLPMFPQMADSHLRIHCAFLVDGTGLQHPRHCQPDPGSAHRLALVHDLAVRVRIGCRFRSQSGCESAHSSVPGAALRGPRGLAYRSWRAA